MENIIFNKLLILNFLISYLKNPLTNLIKNLIKSFSIHLYLLRVPEIAFHRDFLGVKRKIDIAKSLWVPRKSPSKTIQKLLRGINDYKVYVYNFKMSFTFLDYFNS